MGEHVVQAEQPLQVGHRREQRRDHAADPLRRRVGRAQLGELLLDLVQRRGCPGRTRRRRSSACRARDSGTERRAASRSAPRAAAWPRSAPSRSAPPIISGRMAAASRHQRSASRACFGDAPARPQAGVITTCGAHCRRRQVHLVPQVPDDPRGVSRSRPLPFIAAGPSAGARASFGAVAGPVVGSAPISSPRPASAASAKPSKSPRRSWLGSNETPSAPALMIMPERKVATTAMHHGVLPRGGEHLVQPVPRGLVFDGADARKAARGRHRAVQHGGQGGLVELDEEGGLRAPAWRPRRRARRPLRPARRRGRRPGRDRRAPRSASAAARSSRRASTARPAGS